MADAITSWATQGAKELGMNREKSSKKKFQSIISLNVHSLFRDFSLSILQSIKRMPWLSMSHLVLKVCVTPCPANKDVARCFHTNYAICICSSHILTMGKFSSKHCSCMLNHVVPKRYGWWFTDLWSGTAQLNVELPKPDSPWHSNGAKPGRFTTWLFTFCLVAQVVLLDHLGSLWISFDMLPEHQNPMFC